MAHPVSVSVRAMLEYLDRYLKECKGEMESIRESLTGDVYDRVKVEGYVPVYSSVERVYANVMVRLSKVSEVLMDLDNVKGKVAKETGIPASERSQVFGWISGVERSAELTANMLKDVRHGLEFRLKLLASLQYLGLGTSLLERA